MADELRWGARVLIRAEVVRVIAEPHEDGHRFKQSVGESYGRFVLHEFGVGDRWPGEPIDETWQQGPKGYLVTPAVNGKVLARVRRLPLENPEVGVIIGFTSRQEGVIATVAGATQLYPPNRMVPLLEVALPPATTVGKARIVLAHRFDAYVVAAEQLA